MTTSRAASTYTTTTEAGSSGPSTYSEGQVVPVAVNASGPQSQAAFAPQVVRLVVGINNTVSFENVGNGFVGVGTIKWPSNATGFLSDILGHGASWSTTLLVPGEYEVNDYLHPVLGSLSILVVAVPDVSSATNANDTVTMRGELVCSSDCSGGQAFAAQLSSNGDIALATLYLNGTQSSYRFDLNLLGSQISVERGDAYFVEMLVRFADGNVAVATAVVTAS